jgi:hypothetical protein
MLLSRNSLCNADAGDCRGSPAILRLHLLEARFASRRPMTDDARISAHDLIASLRRAIAEKPSLSFADVVAKLKTCDEMAAENPDERLDNLQKTLLKSALADLVRMQPKA